MTPDETTRIEFAERQGWQWTSNGMQHRYLVPPSTKTKFADPSWPMCDDWGDYSPNPTNRGDVHKALMRMSALERQEFCILLSKTYDQQDRIVERVLFETHLSTLVSCYLEATKGRVKP